MTLRRLIDFVFGPCCFCLAIAMFFCFPGVEAWTFTAFAPLSATPRILNNLMLIFLVAVPAMLGPVVLFTGARRYPRHTLAAGCLALAALFLVAGAGTPLLYGRVALMALLSGHMLALGRLSKESVPYNWMVYLGFIVANCNFPDGQILAGANLFAGTYLAVASVLLFTGVWSGGEAKKDKKKSRYGVMVG